MKKTVYEALNWASSFLRSHGLEEPAGEWLLRHHLKANRAALLASFHDDMSEDVWLAFKADVETLPSGIPVQHIIGSESFYGRVFSVSGDVLIPRPETEELVEAVLERLEGTERIVDIGTGSGAIAITLQLESPGTEVTAIDLSEKALNVAQENAKTLGATVRFKQGDLCQPVKRECFDVIVSNPPYIPERDRASLAEQVREYEPELALFAGDDGLAVYRRLATELLEHVRDGSLIALEIGAGQGNAVKQLFQEQFPKATIEIRFDINEKDRIVLIDVRL
ncbi:peptide chain release factor N(5)-glutamine methyltransferase [Shouchella lehensis]|uniref:Release factor glutamine methyltransferase n=1 Tax=Shouchella lehensis TaxID=300825 RepID=A0A4Y7WF89_9BACI|nr:peptide chain release factor N(5)-glutamine methyltransferase [Shouchella lehensis]MBG9785164.1 SAM-dependent methyltransferase [Shouchella lehensis]TES46602.1 peptide chain release factor N(5)-glutamine methyltransferase [Shouchella lehensis]